MNPSQLSFYKKVKQNLSQGQYIDVNGNISYVFAYIYGLLQNWKKNGFENLSDRLLYLSELYNHESILSNYCRYWSYDCLLGLRKLDEFIEKTEPIQVFGTPKHQSNLRLNIQRQINKEANPIDLFLLAGGRKNKIIVSNQGLFKEKIREIYRDYGEKNGGWFRILNNWLQNKKLEEVYLFNGVPNIFIPLSDMKIYSYHLINQFLKLSKELTKKAENNLRKDLNIPLIGEGWVSETLLFKKLETHFSYTKVIQHGQPIWLGRQHYDIWFPHWRIAVEYHGKQHFEPVDFFGGESAYLKNIERDKRKINLSKRHRVKLLIVTENYEISDVILEIEHHISKRKRFLFS